MKFSVVIPLYNKESFISETIDSVLSQTYNDYEVVIVNDSSTDNSLNVATQYSDTRIKVLSKPNGGVSSSRNFGILNSSGDVICFLDADDIWKETYLEELSKLLDLYPTCGMFCGAYQVFKNSKSNVVRTMNLPQLDASFSNVVDFFKLSAERFSIIALTSAVSVRRSVLEQMDYWFDERFSRGEDTDMWVRTALITHTVFSNNPLMLYRSDTEGGLMTSSYDFNNSAKCWNWYNLSKSKNVRLFTTQRIYALAKQCYNEGLYKKSIFCLNKIQGFDIILMRAILFLRSLVMLIINILHGHE